jgi:cytidylate kinase
VEYLNLSSDQAREFVLREDQDRRAYVKQYFRRDIGDASLYDLIINTDTVPLEQAVMIIADMVLRAQTKPPA